MNREILFRGKDNQTGEWLYSMIISKHCCNDKEIFSYYIGHGNRTIDAKTLGQYTGLTDKYGTKIFEGDIIKQECCGRPITSVIEYGISYAYSNVCGVVQRFRDGSGISMLSVNEDGTVYCEVIGNIYDNPELLKRSDAE